MNAPVRAETRVVVAIPTYFRPEGLATALHHVLLEAVSLEREGPYNVTVSVIDNDPDGSGHAVIAALNDPRVRHVVEPRPGISAVRNRAFAESPDADLLAFIDDDERPHEGWLTNLVRTQQTTGAAAVSGRVVPEYQGDLDPWIEAGRFFIRRQLRTGTTIEVAATNNLLLDMSQVRRADVRFDESLGLSGGEDNLFSQRLARAGGRLVWCNEAVVTDLVPRARMNRRWVLTRAMSHGNSVGIVGLHLAASNPSRWLTCAQNLGGGMSRVVGGSGRWLVGRVTKSARHEARGLRAAFRGAGMAAAGLGLTYQEYGRNSRRWRRWRN